MPLRCMNGLDGRIPDAIRFVHNRAVKVEHEQANVGAVFEGTVRTVETLRFLFSLIDDPMRSSLQLWLDQSLQRGASVTNLEVLPPGFSKAT